MSAVEHFKKIAVGDVITGNPFTPAKETIKAFAEASLDFNPLHFDTEFMKRDFGKTNFGGEVIMHGMSNFSLITRTLTDWLIDKEACHRRLETRWLKPVHPGDTITAIAVVSDKVETVQSNWVLFDIEVTNQKGDMIATGQAMAEFPDVFPWGPPAM